MIFSLEYQFFFYEFWVFHKRQALVWCYFVETQRCQKLLIECILNSVGGKNAGEHSFDL
jgi:hypothetical protein